MPFGIEKLGTGAEVSEDTSALVPKCLKTFREGAAGKQQANRTQTCPCGPTCSGLCPAASPHYASIRSVGPLSSEDVAVVVDSHWFTDCHLEAIFNMNKSRLQLRSPTTVDGKDVRLITGVSL